MMFTLNVRARPTRTIRPTGVGDVQPARPARPHEFARLYFVACRLSSGREQKQSALLCRRRNGCEGVDFTTLDISFLF